MMEPSRIATSLLAGFLALPVVHAWRERRRPLEEPDKTSIAWHNRQDALQRARVFAWPAGNIGSVDFSTSPHDANPYSLDSRAITCRYRPKETKATTPKFDCELPDGEVIKVKYHTLEIQAEVAATRLLAGLGFGTDYVMLVERLECQGCPSSNPFRTRRLFEHFSASFLLDRFTDPDRQEEFHWVSVERRIPGRPFELDEYGGWHVTELEQVDPAKGGATRAEVDALRLMALVIGHWDNKFDNQRLVCREDPDGEESDKPCKRPLLVIHDLGATFGMRRVDLPTWKAMPIWEEGAGCRGSAFVPTDITEEGRRLLASRLQQLSRQQLTTLFRAARFPDPATGAVPAEDVSPWVDAFQAKVREVTDRPACPPARVMGRTASLQ
jgi:hypothetical protein